MIIVRRKKLGKTSCEAIVANMKEQAVVWRNDQPFPEVRVDNVFLRWGCTSNLPPLEDQKKIVINEAKGIHTVNNKSGFRKILNESGYCPETWFSYATFLEEMTARDEKDRTPVIVRPQQHAQGRDLYYCEKFEEVRNACNRLGDGCYISEYIKKVAEYRVCVVSGRVAWVAKKTPADENAIAWNVAQGGRFDNVRWKDWPANVVDLAVRVWELTGLDFSGIDIMVDEKDNAYCLEANSAPSLTSPYRQQCMAKCFDYIIENGKDKLPLSHDRKGYGRYIHPAIDAKEN